MMANWLRIVVWVVVFLGVFVAFGFIQKQSDELVCSGVDIVFSEMDVNRFVTEREVYEMLHVDSGASLLLLEQSKLHQMEYKVSHLSPVKKVTVFRTINGRLRVQLVQRKPMVRIYSGKESYYMDEDGYLMSLSKKYTARVPIVTGNVYAAFGQAVSCCYADVGKDSCGQKILYDVYRLAREIVQSDFWYAQIEQMYVDKDSHFVLIPKVGKHKIVLGEVQQVRDKLNKLSFFYMKGLSKVGWNKYEKIDLTYKDQIVCTKKQ